MKTSRPELADAPEQASSGAGTGVAPGKRTLTMSLPPPGPLTKPTDEQARRADAGEGPWWHSRQECIAGGEAHSLYFLGEAGAARLVINPNPQYLSDWLTAAKATVESRAHDRVGDFEVIQADVTKLQKIADAEQEPKDKWKTITGLIQQIGNRLATLGAATGVAALVRPQTDVGWTVGRDAHGNEYGRVMHAKVLSLRPGNSPGGSPPEAMGVFSAISSRHSAFVRGHLLNKWLHGPGLPPNLAVITDAVNKDMSDNVEEPLKNAVLEKNGVVEYKVTAEYGGHGAKDKYTEYDRTVIPTRIVCQWRALAPADEKKPDGAWTSGAPFSEHKITQTLPDADQERKRGHARDHQLMAMALSGELTTGKSKVKKEMIKHAKEGQKTMEDMFARAEAKSKSSAPVRAPSDDEEDIEDEAQDSGDERMGFGDLSEQDVAALDEYRRAQREERAGADSFEALEGGGDDDGRMGGDDED